MGAKQARHLREIARARRDGEDLVLLELVREAFRTDGCGCAACRDAERFLLATGGPHPPDDEGLRFRRNWIPDDGR